MEKLEQKKENIKEQFMNVLLEREWTEEDITELISAFSYYILKTNKSYKYNQTYLTSYCDGFYKLKNYIKDREDMMDLIQVYFERLKDSIKKKYSVEINGLWEIIYEQEDRDVKIKRQFSGNIDKNKLFDDKFFVLVKIFDENRHMSCYEFVIKDISLKDKTKLEKELEKIIKQMKKMEIKNEDGEKSDLEKGVE